MVDKIKIYVSEEIYNILLKDMKTFEFFKSDGTVNKNDFINTLIINYYEMYQQRSGSYLDGIQSILQSCLGAEEKCSASLAGELLNFMNSETLESRGCKLDCPISLKPTRKSGEIIDFIQQYHLSGTTLSAYFRNMFTSYALLPLTKREQILFKSQYDLIQSAIRSDRQIFITLKHCVLKHIISPYSIAQSNEETGNYLIAEFEGRPDSFALFGIQQVIILNESRSFTEGIIPKFEKMILHSPQDPILENKEICVQLSRRGEMIYRHLIHYRPVPLRVEEDRYYFDCSEEHILLYFSSFGPYANILYPADLRRKMMNFHQKAADVFAGKGEPEESEEIVFRGSVPRLIFD